MERCVDNKILWDDNLEENFKRVCKYITRCARAGITFNKDKFCFVGKELNYLGFHLSKNLVEPIAKMLQSIAEFPGVRRWFGLTNQVDCFHNDWSIMEPLRQLLKPAKTGEKWADRWKQEQRTAFKNSRTKIVEKIKDGIYAFTPGLTTALGTDWSRTGMGFHMNQKHCKCNLRVPSCYIIVKDTVLINSKAIIPTNLRSQILAALHRSHGGVNGMRARAGEAMFWPGMNADIQRIRDKCKTCRQTAPSKAATPPKSLPVPDYPF